MSVRSYNQYCGIAYALDIIGERWTLLIIRELLLGPRRFKDLHGGLPGIGTNLLTDRLKKLMDYEVIHQRELPPPAASTVYELTGFGEELKPILESLGSWGGRFLGSPEEDDTFNPRWLLLALETKFNPDRTKDIDKVVEFAIDNEVIYAHIKRGTIEVSQGSHPSADLRIISDSKSFIKLVSGSADLEKDQSDLNLTLEGETELFDKLSEWFSVDKPQIA